MDRAERMAKADKLGLKHHEGYEDVLAEAAALRLEKAHTYGESRYEEEDQDFNMGGVYWDVHRKYIRLRQLFRLGWRTVAKRPDGLRDALLDMANYCLMGVQLIDSYLGRTTFSPFKVEQIALHVPNPDHFKEALRLIGLTDWSEDHVWARGEVYGVPTVNQANLNFNYQLGPFELELIKYEEGNNWLSMRGTGIHRPGLSHLGLHIAPDRDMDKIIADFRKLGIDIAQQVTTDSHTNPAIRDQRRYRYVIFNTLDRFGFDLKLIQRLNMDGSPATGGGA